MNMIGYDIPSTDDQIAIGTRAKKIRGQIDMTITQLAGQAGVTELEVEALEKGRDVSLAAALAIHRVLSGDGAEDTLFIRPRLRSIDEVEAFEKRRLGRQ